MFVTSKFHSTYVHMIQERANTGEYTSLRFALSWTCFVHEWSKYKFKAEWPSCTYSYFFHIKMASSVLLLSSE